MSARTDNLLSMSLHTAGPISDSVYALMLATEEEEEFNKQQNQSAGLKQLHSSR